MAGRPKTWGQMRTKENSRATTACVERALEFGSGTRRAGGNHDRHDEARGQRRAAEEISDGDGDGARRSRACLRNELRCAPFSRSGEQVSAAARCRHPG